MSRVPVDKHGNPVRLGFFDAFMGTGPRLERTRSGKMRWVMERESVPRPSRPSRRASAPAVAPEPTIEATQPVQPPPVVQATPVTQAPPVTAPVPVPATVASAATTTTETTDTASINSDALAWTSAQDGTLVGMKALNRSWNEISEAIPGKSVGDLKQRFNELQSHVKSNDKGKGKAKEEEVSVEEGGGKKKGKGKGKGKEVKKQVKFAEPEESEEEEETENEESDSDASYIDPPTKEWPPKLRYQKPNIRQGGKVINVVEMDEDEEEPTKIRGRPIIHVPVEAELDYEHLELLYSLTRKNDDIKWLEVASRFFDKSGKRMSPAALKDMLKNI